MRLAKKIKQSSLIAAAVAVGLVASSMNAFAVSPNYYQTGFEGSPRTGALSDNPAVGYTQSNLLTQNNWSDLNGNNGSAAATVISSAGLPGVGPAQNAQVVKMTAQGGAGGSYADVYTTDANMTAAQVANYGGVVNVNWDMSRAGGASRSSAFGIEIFSKNQDAILASLFLGNANDNSAALLVEDVSNTPSLYAGFGRNDNTWGGYHISMDFNAKTFTVFVDGNTQGTTFAMNAAAQTALSSEGNAIGGIAFANTNDGSDVAYYDNLGVVPEPATISMISVGTLILLAKRPKRVGTSA